MTSPAIELLLRVVEARLEGVRCRGCGGALAGSPMAVRAQRREAIVVELSCRACDESTLLQVTPESDAGVAGVG